MKYQSYFSFYFDDVLVVYSCIQIIFLVFLEQIFFQIVAATETGHFLLRNKSLSAV